MNNWWVSVVVILALIAVGVLLIHLVNAHHRQDIAAYPYSRNPWAPGKRSRSGPGSTSGSTSTSRREEDRHTDDQRARDRHDTYRDTDTARETDPDSGRDTD
ncbi:hypothetical protein [Streptomyces corynorhini]|uniref:Uncharacterized protein n=1 Tax=Streptomyces corynorhini TaxID=2282652 RepID=A0A370B5Z3_9ACTN|nr:hypothetical protein [Streptomyces corynorhini]RDG34815.1 hypothetical protein DVH02_28600 [Streptomyces corynorhini]